MQPEEFVELEIEPIPPDTIDSLLDQLIPYIEDTLQQDGHADLLSNHNIQIQLEEPFPVEGAISLGLTLMAGIALETYKELILPALKKRFKVKQKSKHKLKKANKA